MPEAVPSLARTALVLAAVLLGLPTVAADEFNMDVTSAGIRPGAHVAGPTLSPESLAHRVVLLEFWGVNCPPCIRSMPLLEELHKTLGPQGLVVIGAHAQGGTPEELKAKVAQLDVSFTILDGASVEAGGDFSGIPHCMLFDHTGKCVYRGSPFRAQEAVIAAVKAAPGAILEGRTLAKLPEFNLLLRDEGQFATVLKRARGLCSHKDPETAAEAAFVIEKLEARGRAMLDEAVSAKDADPPRAADLVQRCAVVFKGSEIGTEATKLNNSWRKDRQFQAAVKAGHQLVKLERIRAYVLDQLGGQPDDPISPQMAAEIPSGLKGQVRTLAQGIAKACPGSPLADKAAAIAAEFAPTP